LQVNAGHGESMGSAVVEVIEQLGSEIVLEARAGDLLVTVAGVDSASPLAPGDIVSLSAPAERLHYFDPETERAIR
jgi:hypothetical protein